MPTDGTHIDDRTPSSLCHLGLNCLCRKKVMVEIDLQTIFPVFRSDLLRIVPFVTCCIVDQHPDRPKFFLDLLDCILEG